MTRPILDLAAIIATLALSSTNWASDERTPCSDFVDRSAELNAPQLFDAVAPCVAERRSFDATLLMVEGQVRALTDMGLLQPKKDEDKLTAANLYGRIFYQTGGAGDRELYRDPARTQALFDRIDAWVPVFGVAYDPGWHYRKRPTETEYGDSIKYGKLSRIAQLRWYASLVRNDRYYAAESEFADIQRRNPKGIVAGSSDFARYQELSQTMNAISKSVERPKLPKPKPFVYTPDPDADFKQVFIGFNGPDQSGAALIQSEEDARASWISSAIAPEEFKKLLAQVAFDTQVLVVFTVGERETATGQVFVTDASYNSLLDAFSVDGVVGVNDEDCSLPRARSYPYAIVIAARPPKLPRNPGFGISNFGDGCKQPKSGAPSPSPVPKR
jgi:hypothetical protein